MPLPNYSEIVELLKKGSTLEAQEKIMQLREASLELQEQNLALKEEIRNLKARLDREESLIFEKGLYWLQDEENAVDGPFCPKCHDTKDQMVRMHKDGSGWWCFTCTEGFNT